MNSRIILIVLIIVSTALPGCVETPTGTPAPTVKPAATETITPTPVATISTPTATPTTVPTLEPGLPVRYRVWIDSDLGFYMVRAMRGNSTLNLSSDFEILNFSIKVGDKVRWLNDDSYDFPLTLVSKEGLWTGRAGLMRYQGERVEYIFNNTGTYTFSIQEFPRIAPQRITVNP
ncbi:MAG TPA: hypothetical protein VIO58_00285 [Candidatus Methanoperedens sp.]